MVPISKHDEVSSLKEKKEIPRDALLVEARLTLLAVLKDENKGLCHVTFEGNAQFDGIMQNLMRILFHGVFSYNT